jgi:hypothetical protein
MTPALTIAACIVCFMLGGLSATLAISVVAMSAPVGRCPKCGTQIRLDVSGEPHEHFDGRVY